MVRGLPIARETGDEALALSMTSMVTPMTPEQYHYIAGGSLTYPMLIKTQDVFVLWALPMHGVGRSEHLDLVWPACRSE